VRQRDGDATHSTSYATWATTHAIRQCGRLIQALEQGSGSQRSRRHTPLCMWCRARTAPPPAAHLLLLGHRHCLLGCGELRQPLLQLGQCMAQLPLPKAGLQQGQRVGQWCFRRFAVPESAEDEAADSVCAVASKLLHEQYVRYATITSAHGWRDGRQWDVL
jgi:hypothetical protein